MRLVGKPFRAKPYGANGSTPASPEGADSAYESDPSRITEHAEDPLDDVRRLAAENPNTPRDELLQLARDPKWIVRVGVTYNPSTPTSVLEMLTGDESDTVRSKAEEALRERHSAQPSEVPAAALDPEPASTQQPTTDIAPTGADPESADDEPWDSRSTVDDSERLAEPTSIADKPGPSTTEERSQVRTSTRDRMRYAAENYGLEQLQATLQEAHNLSRFTDLDRAMQIAIDTVVRAMTEGRPEETRRYCGSNVMTGYTVGRAMLGTAGGALHYSNPLTEADNVEKLVRLSTTLEAASFTREIGPTGQLFVEFQIEMAGRAGPLSPLPQEERANLAGGTAAAGMVLAVVEHDLFAA